MTGIEIAFLITISILVLTSLAVVLIRNPVRATFMLILSFFPTTVVYFFLHASFVGVLQILVYAGAILVHVTHSTLHIGSGCRDRRFEQLCAVHKVPVRAHNHGVVGSNPTVAGSASGRGNVH